MSRIFNKKHQSFTLQNFLKKNLGGFTLVEILVIITIIGILAGIILVAMGPAREKAKDTKIESTMLQVQQLAENIYLDDGSYNNLATTNAEVASIENDLDTLGSIPLTIEKSSTQYCAFAPLHSENNCLTPRTENFCVDSWGTVKRLGVPSGDYCKDNFICIAYFDINNDGAISLVDLQNYENRYFGCTKGIHDCYDPRADFDSDGAINMLDSNQLMPPHFCNI